MSIIGHCFKLIYIQLKKSSYPNQPQQQQPSLFPLGEVGYMDQITPLCYRQTDRIKTLNYFYVKNIIYKNIHTLPVSANMTHKTTNYLVFYRLYSSMLYQIQKKWYLPLWAKTN